MNWRPTDARTLKSFLEGAKEHLSFSYKEIVADAGYESEENYRYLKDHDHAEDIVHDVILELYSRKQSFPTLEALKSWLFSAIKNRCLNDLRHLRAGDRYAREMQAGERQEFFLENIIEEETYFLLRQAIRQLDSPLRRIYELTLQGKSNEEIARALDLTLDSVKSYKKRGKQVLKEMLKDLYLFLSVPL